MGGFFLTVKFQRNNVKRVEEFENQYSTIIGTGKNHQWLLNSDEKQDICIVSECLLTDCSIVAWEQYNSYGGETREHLYQVFKS